MSPVFLFFFLGIFCLSFLSFFFLSLLSLFIFSLFPPSSFSLLFPFFLLLFLCCFLFFFFLFYSNLFFGGKTTSVWKDATSLQLQVFTQSQENLQKTSLKKRNDETEAPDMPRNDMPILWSVSSLSFGSRTAGQHIIVGCKICERG